MATVVRNDRYSGGSKGVSLFPFGTTFAFASVACVGIWRNDQRSRGDPKGGSPLAKIAGSDAWNCGSFGIDVDLRSPGATDKEPVLAVDVLSKERAEQKCASPSRKKRIASRRTSNAG